MIRNMKAADLVTLCVALSFATAAMYVAAAAIQISVIRTRKYASYDDEKIIDDEVVFRGIAIDMNNDGRLDFEQKFETAEDEFMFEFF